MKLTDSRNPRTCVVIPAYNEQNVITDVLERVLRVTDIVVVVDDGSTDDTSKRVSAFPVTLIRHRINLGQGAALQTGLDFACTLPVDFVVTFDADRQNDSMEVKCLVA
jgi:glycosyltransferase involved in cell wall biosynthesis